MGFRRIQLQSNSYSSPPTPDKKEKKRIIKKNGRYRTIFANLLWNVEGSLSPSIFYLHGIQTHLTVDSLYSYQTHHLTEVPVNTCWNHNHCNYNASIIRAKNKKQQQLENGFKTKFFLCICLRIFWTHIILSSNQWDLQPQMPSGIICHKPQLWHRLWLTHSIFNFHSVNSAFM